MRLIDWLDKYFSRNENVIIDKLNVKVDKLKVDVSNLQLLFDEDEAYIKEQAKVIAEQNEELKALMKAAEPDPLEAYWNNKRPSINRLYPARHIYGDTNNTMVDPRIFFQTDSTLPDTSDSNNDMKAMRALKHVIKYVNYVGDEVQFKRPETWMFAFETWKRRRGDCEDGAILLANMMLKSGIPYWRIRLNAGDVEGGGHCWVTYLREEDDKWYILDWCYWPEDSVKWLEWKDAEKYFDIWFSWNNKFIFGDEELDR